MKSKKYASVDVSHCVACGACEKTCPRGAIAVFRVGCLLCARTCPASAIFAKEREA